MDGRSQLLLEGKSPQLIDMHCDGTSFISRSIHQRTTGCNRPLFYISWLLSNRESCQWGIDWCVLVSGCCQSVHAQKLDCILFELSNSAKPFITDLFTSCILEDGHWSRYCFWRGIIQVIHGSRLETVQLRAQLHNNFLKKWRKGWVKAFQLNQNSNSVHIVLWSADCFHVTGMHLVTNTGLQTL